MVWYTIDGLFFYSIAIVLCRQKNKYVKMLGYVLVGVTYLIKQNFIFLLPATIILLGDWKLKRYWLSLFAPLALFYGFFFPTAGLYATISQTTSRTEFVQAAIKAFTSKFTFPWGIIFGFTGSLMLQKKHFAKVNFGFLLLLCPVLYSVFYFHNSGKLIYDASFFLFGTVLGITIYFLRKKMYKIVSVMLLGVMAAWTVAISGGYNTPVFASGILFLYIFFTLRYFLNLDSDFGQGLSKILIVILILIFPVTLYSFFLLRIYSIYSEVRPAMQLTYSVAKVLPGGKNIFTSKEVYDVLSDLQSAEKIAEKERKPYAILPGDAALWVKSKQANPLMMDYPFIFNNQKALIEPLVNNIKNEKGKIIIILGKGCLTQPVDNSEMGAFPICLIPQKYYQKFSETKYFFLYK
jgi:hypothetical protein